MNSSILSKRHKTFVNFLKLIIMKQTKFLMAIMVATVLLFITSCEQQAVVIPLETDTQVTLDEQENPGDIDLSQFRLSHFSNRSEFWTSDEIEDVVDNSIYGRSPQMAPVPLVFDENGQLHTPESYNNLLADEDDQDENVYWTTARTFGEVIGFDKVSHYVDVLNRSDDKAFFIYDPYVTEHVTLEESINQFQTAIQAQGTDIETRGVTPGNILGVGDILVSDYSSDRNIFGHMGIILKNHHDQLDGGSPTHNETLTVEAIKKKKKGSGDSVKKVVVRHYKNHWNKSDFSLFGILRVSGRTWGQRVAAANYANSRVGKPYRLLTRKKNTKKYYCSKLVWQAYKYTSNLDIDYNGGFFVTPMNVLRMAVCTDDLQIRHRYGDRFPTFCW